MFSYDRNKGYGRSRASLSPPSSVVSSRYTSANARSRGHDVGSDAWWEEVAELRQRIGALEVTRPASGSDGRSSSPALRSAQRESTAKDRTLRGASSELPLAPDRTRETPTRASTAMRSHTSMGIGSNGLPAHHLSSPYDPRATQRTPLPQHSRPQSVANHSPATASNSGHQRLLLDAFEQFERQLVTDPAIPHRSTSLSETILKFTTLI